MTIFPSVYMGSVGYWGQMLEAERPVIDEGEYFIKQTYRNRTEIAAESGISPLIIPLEKGKNAKIPMHEVRISYAENWQALHYKTICSAYGSSAYFEHYEPTLKSLFSEKIPFLTEWNTLWRNFFCDEFVVDKSKIETVREYVENTEEYTDFRKFQHPKFRTYTTHDPYYHVFFDKYPKPSNLSVLDLLMNEGPSGKFILKRVKTTF